MLTLPIVSKIPQTRREIINRWNSIDGCHNDGCLLYHYGIFMATFGGNYFSYITVHGGSYSVYSDQDESEADFIMRIAHSLFKQPPKQSKLAIAFGVSGIVDKC